MPESVACSREVVDSQGNGLRVEFVKIGDRFGHTVLGVSAGETMPMFCSLEGTAEDFAPPSPPFAELHQQGEVLFLSGATTIGHWSASVTADEQGLQFDVACRLKKETHSLGSAYQVLSAENQNALVIESLPKEGSLDGDIVQLANDEKGLARVACLTRGPFAVPTTIQWRYRITSKSP